MSRSELRAIVFERDGYRCIWPQCVLAAEEAAHAHSIGAGGRKSADEVSNIVSCCWPHARMSDGLKIAGWDYGEEHRRLLGDSWAGDRLGWRRAEALRALVSDRT